MAHRWEFISRAAVSDSGTLHGYAALYDVPTTKQNQFPGTETIGRGSFDAVLDLGEDVRATVDHSLSTIGLLGSRTAGTLRLTSDDTGLGYEIDAPDTQTGRDIRTLVSRGDVRGASFLAAMNRATIERTAGGVIHRSFNQLFDVCITAMPAYDETSVAARTAAGHSLAAQLAAIRMRAFRERNSG